jgi:hypothetical protein
VPWAWLAADSWQQFDRAIKTGQPAGLLVGRDPCIHAFAPLNVDGGVREYELAAHYKTTGMIVVQVGEEHIGYLLGRNAGAMYGDRFHSRQESSYFGNIYFNGFDCYKFTALLRKMSRSWGA